MVYAPQTWNDNDPATPLTAARLNYIEAGIVAASAPRPIDFDIRDFGAKFDNSSDDTAAYVAAYAAAYSLVAGNTEHGARILLPNGKSLVTSLPPLPRAVQVEGRAGGGSSIYLTADIAAATGFAIVGDANDPIAFASRYTSVLLDAQGHADYTAYSSKMQEGAGIFYCTLRGANARTLYLTGGACQNFSIIGNGIQAPAQACEALVYIESTGGGPIHFGDNTLNGGGTFTVDHGLVVKTTARVAGFGRLHIEHTTDGVYLAGTSGNVKIPFLLGHSTITNLVNVDSTFTGNADFDFLDGNSGFTGVLVNDQPRSQTDTNTTGTFRLSSQGTSGDGKGRFSPYATTLKSRIRSLTQFDNGVATLVVPRTGAPVDGDHGVTPPAGQIDTDQAGRVWTRKSNGTYVAQALQSEVVPAGAQTSFRRSSDLAAITSTTLVSDDQLVLPIGANEHWVIRLWLLVTAANTAMDFKIGWSYPSGCSLYWGPEGNNNTAVSGFGPGGTSGTIQTIRRETDTLNLGSAAGMFGVGVTALVANGATPGSVIPRYAQSTSDAGNLVINAESTMIAFKT